MIHFLITSILCQIALFAVYKGFLENAKMHRFNRAFLLFALVFCIAIPFVKIPVETQHAVQNAPQVLQLLPVSYAIAPENSGIDYGFVAIVSVYVVGLLIFSFRFVKNLVEIKTKITSNEIEKRGKIYFVLQKSETIPHTFLNYVFVNADDFRNGLDSELFTHEIAHVRQKHSFDVLFVEALKTVFWFNPILVLYKKAIQLNHEFLADEAVVAHHDSISYQELLLSKAHFPSRFALASSFNFSITKKRMIMMTKTTSLLGKTVKTIGSVCAFAVLTAFFSVESIAQGAPPPPPPPPKAAPSPYYSGTAFHIRQANGKIVTKNYDDLTASEKASLPPPPPKPVRVSPSAKQFQSFSQAGKYAVWIDGKHVKNSDLSKYSASDFVLHQESEVSKDARSKQYPQPVQVNLYTEKGYRSIIESADFPKVVAWHFDADGSSVLKPEGETKSSLKQWKSTPAKAPQAKKDMKTGDETASFPGGFEKFYAFFNAAFKKPADFNGSERIVLKFAIDENGKVANVETVRASTAALGEEAKRAMRLSPDWIPAKKDGVPVKTEFHLPITVK